MRTLQRQERPREAGAVNVLLAPLSVESFFDEHFEQSPVHVSRNEPGYFAGVYSVAELEDSLLLGTLEPDQFALVKAGHPEAARDQVTYRRPGVRWRQTGKAPRVCLDPRQVVHFVERGYTLLIKDATLFSAALLRFCNELQSVFDSYVQANVYFSPPGTQGFETHHDTHDIIVAQIEGAKRWRIYEPIVTLPLETQPLVNCSNLSGLRLLDEVELRAGDSLYVPRGYPHEAVSSDRRSLHVTFALLPARMIDLVHEVLRVAADDDVELRRALPRDWYNDESAIHRLSQLLASRLAKACAPHRIRAASCSLLGERFAVTRIDAQDAFSQQERLGSVKPTSTLRLQAHVPCAVTEGETTINVLIAGRSLEFPVKCRAAFHRLLAGPTTVRDLDRTLSPGERAGLIEVLVGQGLVTVE